MAKKSKKTEKKRRFTFPMAAALAGILVLLTGFLLVRDERIQIAVRVGIFVLGAGFILLAASRRARFLAGTLLCAGGAAYLGVLSYQQHKIIWAVLAVIPAVGTLLCGRIALAGAVGFFRKKRLSQVDAMTGLEFEHFTASLLKKLGFKHVEVTRASGDQGVDVLAEKRGVLYAVQCKNYAGKVGNASIQEVYSGKDFYGCQEAIVVTNSYFTESAQELAETLGVVLWDRDDLSAKLRAKRFFWW